MEIFARKSKYAICFELNVQIMKISVKLHVNSYFSHETGILLTKIAKSIELHQTKIMDCLKDQTRFQEIL